MKITRLHIYGFGRFEDVIIDTISPSIQVFYGENEVGKSTLLAFIRAVFFGFPTKQQKELRFEPKTGTAYGGKITLETNMYGSVSIERVKGKATGQVRVYFEDGTIEGEEALPKLFVGMDRSIFEGIFSFDLTGLQGMNQLKSGQLSDYLYGVGMTGNTSMISLEKKLEKQQTELFKPNGKRPSLNQKLMDLESLTQTINDWKDKHDHYNMIVAQVKDIEHELVRVSQNKNKQKARIRELEIDRTLQPLFAERAELKQRLARLPEHAPFPEDGLNRLELIKDKLVTSQSEKIEYERKMKDLDEKVNELTLHDDVLSYKEEIDQIKENLRVHDLRQEELRALKQKVETDEEELSASLEQLGKSWNDGKINRCETSVTVKDQLKGLLDDERRTRQQLEFYELELEKRSASLKEVKQQIKELEIQIIPNAEREKLEQQQHAYRANNADQRHVENALTSLEQRLNQQGKGPFSQISLLVWFILVGVVATSVWRFYLGDWLTGGLLVVIAFIGTLTMKRRESHAENLAVELQKQKQIIESNVAKEFPSVDRDDLEHGKFLLAKDTEFRQQLHVLEMSESSEQQAYKNTLLHCEELEKRLRSIYNDIDDWAERNGFPANLQADQYLDVFELVERAKRFVRAIERTKKQAREIATEIENEREKVQYVCNQLGIRYQTSHHRLVEYMLQLVEREEDTRRRQQRWLSERRDIEDHYAIVNDQINYYQTEVESLFAHAGVHSEDHYRLKGKAKQDHEAICQRLALVNDQIKRFLPRDRDIEQKGAEIRDMNEGELQEQIRQLEERIETFENEEQQYNRQRAKLIHQIEELEKGGSYSYHLQLLETKQAGFNDEARKWALYSVASQLIKETKVIYENERQPKVIQQAGHYFAKMTSGEYTKVFAPIGEERFIIERRDGLRFTPDELSRGTAEQLYLSLRLALAAVYESSSPNPMIMDDILVNFDEKRTKAAIEVIDEVAKRHQVIFFTCHHHLLPLFEQADVHRLGEI
ncbi:ATP-binding protein [Desertibacillus haloalkaliphilus]|uniref:ATP-binding protein n=1 Tax=Desertibacillus haloalkaliphilus TaxID=1328930 RepID=UPI001C2752D6|nr:AAA family ATPase [Desertibacillus haloalkaliphilus]MBU8905443.1 AAA family ATPase [Desertibacillus haloalkaliphilus]